MIDGGDNEALSKDKYEQQLNSLEGPVRFLKK